MRNNEVTFSLVHLRMKIPSFFVFSGNYALIDKLKKFSAQRLPKNFSLNSHKTFYSQPNATTLTFEQKRRKKNRKNVSAKANRICAKRKKQTNFCVWMKFDRSFSHMNSDILHTLKNTQELSLESFYFWKSFYVTSEFLDFDRCLSFCMAQMTGGFKTDREAKPQNRKQPGNWSEFGNRSITASERKTSCEATLKWNDEIKKTYRLGASTFGAYLQVKSSALREISRKSAY